MGVELLIKMRKGVIFTIRGCFGSVRNHPFLVCLLSVLVFIYKSSPFTFSLFVSASPVLVCAAVLLGTVLFFAQPNAPEVRVKEEASRELSKDGNVEMRDDSQQLGDGICIDGGSDEKKSEAESFDLEMVNVESLASSSWKQIQQQDDGDGSDSVSDEAESSPDASTAEMIPMLDEVHPLLDEDVPQPTQCSSSSNGSVDETNNQDDEDDEYEAEMDKGFRSKSVITWTEEDQKNLMQVKSSEIERNQRLENLILRRNRRKNVSMVPEIDLIDLESSDIPINIPSISTSRKNPFDAPNDSYDNAGLPIPGSAPSILLPRRNPFDIPFDESPEQNQNITGDQSRDPFFRRNIGPSGFAPDNKMRPDFVPERMVLDESGYSTLQQQPGDAGSVSSVENQHKVSKIEFSGEDAAYEAEVIPVYDSSPRRGKDGISSALSEVDQLTDEQSQGDKRLGELEGRSSLAIPIGPPQVEGGHVAVPTGAPQVEGGHVAVPTRAPQVEAGQVGVEDSVDKEESIVSPTSDPEFQEAFEKISTPTTGDSTTKSHFYVRAMHEKAFEHLEEVQVPNTPVEPSENGKARGIQNIDIPELHELDSQIPESIPRPSGEVVSQVDTQTMGDAEEIKDFHQSKIDSIAQSETEKHINAYEENDVNAAEVNPVEVNKIEHYLKVGKSGEETGRSVELEGETLESSLDEELIIGEEETKIPEDVHYTSDTETERTTKSSTSPPSLWAKRRLSTPFF